MVHSNQEEWELGLAFPLKTSKANHPSRSNVIFLCDFSCPSLFGTPYPISSPPKVNGSLDHVPTALNNNSSKVQVELHLSALVSVSFNG